MHKYLYCFGFQTPALRKSKWDDEDSQTIVILCNNKEQALEWGHEISEKFIHTLFGNEEISWKADQYASWIEDDYSEFDKETLDKTPCVNYGEYPDCANMIKEQYPEEGLGWDEIIMNILLFILISVTIIYIATLF